MSWKPTNTPPTNTSTENVRVLYADTDRMDVVYHATYLRWFEAGRAHFMRSRGISYAAMEQGGIQLPVVETHLVYHKPAKYDEVLDVTTWLHEMGRAQMRFEYLISRGGDALVRGYTHHAAVNESGRPVRIPGKIKDCLESYQTTKDE